MKMEKRTVYICWTMSMLLLAGGFFGCKKRNKQMEIVHTQLPATGIAGNLQKGVSASYAALIQGRLIVAGGANFPDKLGFEGGKKVFYDEILLFDAAKKQWKSIGKLPQASAYGVSVPLADGALWIGGCTDSTSLAAVYKVTVSDGDSLHMEVYPSLPGLMDNFAGCTIADRIFIASGSEDGKAGCFFYTIDPRKETAWRKLPDYPGIPRTQPVMAALYADGKEWVYLLGGFFTGNGEAEPCMATDILRYSVTDEKWEKVGVLEDPQTGTVFSLGGATAMPVENRYILCMGGVNHDVFLEAVTAQYRIANDPSTSAEQKKALNFEFSKHYMTQPPAYYRFNREYRLFDTQTNTWQTIDRALHGARAGATLVFDGHTFFAIQGELKPGVRSVETWKGEIEIK